MIGVCVPGWGELCIEGYCLCGKLGVGQGLLEPALMRDLLFAEYPVAEIGRRAKYGAAISQLPKNQTFPDFAAETFADEMVFHLCHDPFLPGRCPLQNPLYVGRSYSV